MGLITNEFADNPTPPPPPPKGNDRHEYVGAAPPVGMSLLNLDIPLSPASPTSPLEKTRKYSPLADLVESEKAYVELLTGIIRKVASAWSRSNLPPPELDIMFRSVEGVYKINRALLAKLKELGENPSSPKALGDLLMRWIDELEQPYMTYANKYCIGFDGWEPVRTNPKVSIVLQAFSASNPPPSIVPTYLLDPSLWTLDALFLLPRGRLQYYRKLYSRLLKSTTPGRSDHRLLTGALGKLDGLLATLDERSNIGVCAPGSHHAPPPHVNTEQNPTAVTPTGRFANIQMESTTLLSGQFGSDPASAATSMRGSFSSRDERFSQETSLTSNSRESSQTLASSVVDLEKRLATEKTLDLFSMQPKLIRLQIMSPTLPFTRELRLSAKVVVRFTPKITGVEVVHRHGHIYILSDLFLVCEKMTPEEQAIRGENDRDTHLCYPPLSGKVLNVTGVPGQENVAQVSIMRRETLVLEADSQVTRDRILDEFRECISFAKTMSRAAQEPVPPVPPISCLPGSPITHPSSSSRERPERALNPRSRLHSQSIDVQSDVTSAINKTLAALSPRQDHGLPLPQISPEQIHDDSCGSHQKEQISTSHNIFPPRTSSVSRTTNSPPSSFVPGQIIPLLRSTSTQSHSPPFTAPASDLPGGQGRLNSPPIVQNHALQNPVLRHQASMHSIRQQPLQHQPPLHTHRPDPPSYPPISHPQLSSNGQPSPPMIPLSEGQSLHRLQKSQSSRSLHAQYQPTESPLPPIPLLPDGLPAPQRPYDQRKDSVGSLNSSMSRLILPSMQMGSRANSFLEPSILEPSPPASPIEERKLSEPLRSVVTVQTKCKVFHKQHHAQWKSLGSANLTLYNQEPTNIKQLVVEASSKSKTMLISTIVLTDGVERVGKTGVAIELSDEGGARTGIIHMIQLRNEDSASKLFRALLAGSDRAA